MRADHLSYKRAAGVSLLGGGLQGAIGLILLVYSLVLGDHAGFTAALAVLAGCIVWICLAIVFDQHRRERLEFMEAETLAASGGRASSAFDEAKDELRVAAQRLAWMHKALLPVVSLILAALLMAVGYWRFVQGRHEYNPDHFHAPINAGWTIALGIGIAVIGFVFARFVSGMAKQPVWANLRAGAAQAVGAALLGLAMVVGQFVDLAGYDIVQRALVVAFPVAMMAGGAEIVLNFLLNLYRPRKPGEYARPAFESRFLGFVAAPDRIAESISEALNYQFGFDVSGSWFYRLMSRWIVVLTLIGVLTIWAMTALVVIKPNERGLRVRLGALASEPLMPGAHAKLPWPFESVMRVDATGIRELEQEEGPLFGKQLDQSERGLWVRQKEYEEKFVIVRPSESTGRDWALVTIEVPLHYTIADPIRWAELAEPGSRTPLLRSVARREVMALMATLSTDEVLGNGRAEVSDRILRRVTEAFARLGPDGQGAGVEVVFAGVETARPPVETASSFERVLSSRQERIASEETARKEQITTLANAVGSVDLAREVKARIDELNRMRAERGSPEAIAELTERIDAMILDAGGEAAATLHRARADRWALHMNAKARAEEFIGQREAFSKAPVIYATREYLAALAQAMDSSRLYILPGGKRVTVRANLEEEEKLESALDQTTINEEMLDDQAQQQQQQ